MERIHSRLAADFESATVPSLGLNSRYGSHLWRDLERGKADFLPYSDGMFASNLQVV